MFYRTVFLTLLIGLLIAGDTMSGETQRQSEYRQKCASQQGLSPVEGVLEKALKYQKDGRFEEAIRLLEATREHMPPGSIEDDRRIIDLLLGNLYVAFGRALYKQNRYPEAVTQREKAYALDRELRRNFPEVLSAELDDLVDSCLQAALYEKAVRYGEELIRLARTTKDTGAQAQALTNTGAACYYLGRYDKALEYLQEALPIWRQRKNISSELRTLINLAGVWEVTGNREQALNSLRSAQELTRSAGDPEAEALLTISLGELYARRGENNKALDHFQKALQQSREQKSASVEASALLRLGDFQFHQLALHAEGIAQEEKAVSLFQKLKERRNEAEALQTLGAMYEQMNRLADSIRVLQQALDLAREIKERRLEGFILKNLGDVYLAANEALKAKPLFEQAVAIRKDLKDAQGEAAALNHLGQALHFLQDDVRASEAFVRALALQRAVKDNQGEARVLNNLGVVRLSQGLRAEARRYFEESQRLCVRTKDREGEGIALSSLGEVSLWDALDGKGSFDQVTAYYEGALEIWQEIDLPRRRAETLFSLMFIQQLPDNKHLNVALSGFYGKRFVNDVQSMRGNLIGLEKDLQKHYFGSHTTGYTLIVNVLEAQGRTAEALQVYEQLKQQAYLNFSLDKQNAEQTVRTPVSLTAVEKRWAERLDQSGQHLRAHAETLRSLELLSLPSDTDKQRIQTERNALEADRINYRQTWRQMRTEFTALPPGSNVLTTTPELQTLQQALKTIGPGTAALYTLLTGDAGGDILRLILVTPDGVLSRSKHVAQNEVAGKVEKFRSLLLNPNFDPRPSGTALYDLLLRPLEADLAKEKVRTLLITPDGSLGFIPWAALFDGAKYVAEKWKTGVIVPGSHQQMAAAPSPAWTILAAGVSVAHDRFPALPAVPEELAAIVHTSSNKGLFPGTQLLDSHFTRTAWLDALRQKPSLLHIASHFLFQGNEADSFLLLGDGSKLTLKDFKSLREDLFAGVDLLTLSACETATPAGTVQTKLSNTDEVENFAALALHKGANAVLASLWQVNDASTGLLMREFYQAHQTPISNGKLEALRLAQIALLTGSANATSTSNVTKGIRLVNPPSPGNAPAFKRDPKAPFAHPYYWAAFILIGNCR